MGEKKKDGFWEETFGDESRNPFSDKTDKTMHEAFKELIPDITDEELTLLKKNPDKLSKARVEFILANIQHDPEILRRFMAISKDNNKDLARE